MIELFERKKSYIKITEEITNLTNKKNNKEVNYSVIGNKIDCLGDISNLNNKDSVLNYMENLLGEDINSFHIFNLKGNLFLIKYLSYNKELNTYNEVDRDSAEYEFSINVSTF